MAPRQSNAPAWINVSTQPAPTSLVANPLEEVVEAEERAAALARLDDRLDGLEADALDRTQPEVDDSLLGHPEVDLSLVDVRRQHLDPHPPAVVDMFDEELVALGAVHLGGEHGRHELGRVMGLEVSGLESDHRVRRAVRFVESIAAEVFDQLEDLSRLFLIEPPLEQPPR